VEADKADNRLFVGQVFQPDSSAKLTGPRFLQKVRLESLTYEQRSTFWSSASASGCSHAIFSITCKS
jgi:hypothetical protein